MKMIRRLGMLMALFSVAYIQGCEEENVTDEPHEWFHYFSFVTEEGADFFQSNPNYEIPSVHIVNGGIDASFEDTISVDGVTALGLHPFVWARGSTILLDYNNGDIDTLQITWTPDDIEFASSSNDLQSMDHVFNQNLVNTWDFIDSPMLLFNLQNRNQPAELGNGVEPFLVALVKTPEFTE